MKDIERDAQELEKELREKLSEVREELEQKEQELVARLEAHRLKRQAQVRKQLEAKELVIAKAEQLARLTEGAQEKLKTALKADSEQALRDYLNSVDTLFQKFSEVAEQGVGVDLKNKTITLNVELPLAPLEEVLGALR